MNKEQLLLEKIKLVLAGNHGTCEGDSYDFVHVFEYNSKDDFFIRCL